MTQNDEKNNMNITKESETKERDIFLWSILEIFLGVIAFTGLILGLYISYTIYQRTGKHLIVGGIGDITAVFGALISIGQFFAILAYVNTRQIKRRLR